MGSLARSLRRQQIRKGHSQNHIMQMVRDEVARNYGSAEKLALKMTNQDLSAGTVWVIAALVRAIDSRLKWKRRSKRYYALLEEFNRKYAELLETDDKDAWIRMAEDIANAEFNIYFH